jgi:hypothetical protein
MEAWEEELGQWGTLPSPLPKGKGPVRGQKHRATHRSSARRRKRSRGRSARRPWPVGARSATARDRVRRRGWRTPPCRKGDAAVADNGPAACRPPELELPPAAVSSADREKEERRKRGRERVVGKSKVATAAVAVAGRAPAVPPVSPPAASERGTGTGARQRVTARVRPGCAGRFCPARSARSTVGSNLTARAVRRLGTWAVGRSFSWAA